MEVVALRTLYERDHLDQVLATFGLILFFNELVAIIWGRAAIYTSVPPFLSGHIRVLPGVPLPDVSGRYHPGRRRGGRPPVGPGDAHAAGHA